MDELQELKNRIEAAAQEHEAQFPLTAKMLRGLITGETVPGEIEESKRIKDSLDFTGEEFVKLNELADGEECDGDCYKRSPNHRLCARCKAIDAINEAAEILRETLFKIERDKELK